jgi:tRNA G18 (ribose-2'-O)-methylase SpoU
MSPFTRRKFLTFSHEMQHKKCAALIRKLYEHPDKNLWDHYNEIQGWMNRSVLLSDFPEVMSHRYHEHLNEAKVSLKEHSLLPRIRQGDAVMPLAKRLEASVYLDQIRSAHNVGSILRTVEAFQLGDVYFSPNTPFADHPQVQKTAMGCSQTVLCHGQSTLKELPRPLIALETSPDATPLHQFQFPDSFCLAIGNEEFGLSQNTLEQADILLEIPLYGRKNSLNVANAFAIAAAVLSNQLRSKECYAPIRH